MDRCSIIYAFPFRDITLTYNRTWMCFVIFIRRRLICQEIYYNIYWLSRGRQKCVLKYVIKTCYFYIGILRGYTGCAQRMVHAQKRLTKLNSDVAKSSYILYISKMSEIRQNTSITLLLCPLHCIDVIKGVIYFCCQCRNCNN